MAGLNGGIRGVDNVPSKEDLVTTFNSSGNFTSASSTSSVDVLIVAGGGGGAGRFYGGGGGAGGFRNLTSVSVASSTTFPIVVGGGGSGGGNDTAGSAGSNSSAFSQVAAVGLVGATEDLAAAVVAQEVALEQWTQLNQDFLHLADQETHHQLAHHKETMAVLQI